jgi:hypothetical protein
MLSKLVNYCIEPMVGNNKKISHKDIFPWKNRKISIFFNLYYFTKSLFNIKKIIKTISNALILFAVNI